MERGLLCLAGQEEETELEDKKSTASVETVLPRGMSSGESSGSEELCRSNSYV